MKQLALQLALPLLGRPRFSDVPDRADAADGIAIDIEHHLDVDVDPFERPVRTTNAELQRRCREPSFRSGHRGFKTDTILGVDNSKQFFPGWRRRGRVAP